MRRGLLLAIELFLLVAIAGAVRCANWKEVFVRGNIYFADGDCYARMSRARLIFEHRALVVRHHDFENSPTGTNPHTTAPFDYLIVATAWVIRPFARNPLDIAGAFVSPLLGVVAAIFLWWWSHRMRLSIRTPMLLLFAVSPILVHATKLGRPDHQSLLVLLTTGALCADQLLRRQDSKAWLIASGFLWGSALWVSLYEPVVVLLVSIVVDAIRREALVRSWRRWLPLALVVMLALLIEGRIPNLPAPGNASFAQWATPIGELAHVSLRDPIWLQWFGLLVIAAPLLFFLRARQSDEAPITLIAIACATFALAIWQVRWAYFFGIAFVLLVPSMLAVFRTRWMAACAFAVSLYPVAAAWDSTWWPNEPELQRRAALQNENIDLRALSSELRQREPGAFLAPWWLSPQIAYWSEHPGVGGSSHEAITGNAGSANFYASTDPAAAEALASSKGARYIVSYAPDPIAENSAAILGCAVSSDAICFVLARQPSRAPAFVRAVYQNPSAKLFTVKDSE